MIRFENETPVKNGKGLKRSKALLVGGEGVRHKEVIVDGNLVIGGQYHPFIGTDGSGSSKNQSLDFLACNLKCQCV